jgi:hypothetical protein
VKGGKDVHDRNSKSEAARPSASPGSRQTAWHARPARSGRSCRR